MFLDKNGIKILRDQGAIIGKECKIDESVMFVNPNGLKIGHSTRIDFNCFISGKVDIGPFNHLSPMSILSGGSGKDKIITGWNCTISAFCHIVCHNSDYTKGHSLTNPTVYHNFRENTQGPITLEDFVLLGGHCTILPNTVLPIGSIFGKGCLIKGEKYKPWSTYAIENRPALISTYDAKIKLKMKKECEDHYEELQQKYLV